MERLRSIRNSENQLVRTDLSMQRNSISSNHVICINTCFNLQLHALTSFIGRVSAAAPTWIASKGASSGKPSHPLLVNKIIRPLLIKSGSSRFILTLLN